MSHFSKIKTKIRNLDILKLTLKNLGFNYISNRNIMKNMNRQVQYVDLIAQKNNHDLIGFIWENEEYSLITDLEFWIKDTNIEKLIEMLLQQYALHSIKKSSYEEGFEQIKQEVSDDGSIKITLQRWS